MGRNLIYKNRPCGYCGAITGQNQGEHVLPASFYPPSTDPTIQRIKIPACPNCNGSWEADEAYFRASFTLAGEKPNWARAELWQKVERSFTRPEGKGDLRDVFLSMKPATGMPGRHCVNPGADQRICRVIRKIVRGLCHHLDQNDIIADGQVAVVNVPLPPAFESQLQTVFEVPDVFLARTQYFRNTPLASELHSGWSFRFFETVELVAAVAGGQMIAQLHEGPRTRWIVPQRQLKEPTA